MKLIKSIYRNFLKNRTTGVLSITSLGLGISVFILIGTWFLNEISFDNFHHNPENIYRVCRKGFINNQSVSLGSVFGPIGKTIHKELPEVLDMVRINKLGDAVLTIDGQKNYQGDTYAVDSTFFNFFNFQLKSGSVESFINKPNSILIDEKFAEKYYGGKDPIGKNLSFYGEREVVGILYNPPINSHLNFHALIPMHGIKYLDNMRWGNSDNFNTYIRIPESCNTDELSKKITSIAAEKFPPYKEMNINHFLQPLRSIHFSTDFRFDSAITANSKLIFTFVLLGIIILVVASINFINLFISTSFLRAKSIGIRKTNGAKQKHLIKDFYTETFVYVFIAVVLGLILAQLFLPVFNSLIEYKLTLGFNSKQLYLFIIGITISVTLLAGTFPAFQMSKFNTIATLQEKFKGKKLSLIQKTLIVIQFTATMALLLSVFLIKEQLFFMKNTDFGFNKNQIIYIPMHGDFGAQYKRVCSELEKNAAITQVTVKNSPPSVWSQGHPIAKFGNENETLICESCSVFTQLFRYDGNVDN